MPRPQQTPVKIEQPAASPQHRKSERPVTVAPQDIVCFHCQKKGHKSYQCPLMQVKKVQITLAEPRVLKDNELIGSVGQYMLPITCDSGADVTVVPEECVLAQEFTGDTCEVASFNRKISTGKTCKVVVSIGGRRFSRKAIAQPGADLGWSVCLSLPYRDKQDREFIADLMDQKFAHIESAKEQMTSTEAEEMEPASQMVSDTTEAETHTLVETQPERVVDQKVAQESNRDETTEEPTVVATGEVEEVRVEEDAAEVAEESLGIDMLTLEKEDVEGGLTALKEREIRKPLQ